MICDWVEQEGRMEGSNRPGRIDISAGLDSGARVALSFSILCCPLPSTEEPLVSVLKPCDVGLEI